MTSSSPTLDAVRWARLKEHVADIAEIAPHLRAEAFSRLDVDTEDRALLAQLLAPFRTGDARLREPRPDALAAPTPVVLRYAPGDVVGGYRIEGLLGHGGMGEVYAARPLNGGVSVALKVLLSGLAHQEYAKFSDNEQRALRRLNDKRIAKFIEAFSVPETGTCLVLELVDGEPLLTYCRGRRYSVDARLKLFLEVCYAVASAHQHLVIHRDLKPSNVLVTPDGVVKLLDFGVAKLLDDAADAEPQTHTHGALFTLDFAAPEQILREPASTATDVYALGGLLYRLLVDVSPYARYDSRGMVDAVLHEPPQRLEGAMKRSRLAGNTLPSGPFDRDLDLVIEQAMEKLPAKRYRTALELASDVSAIIEGRPIKSGGGRLYRARKFARVNRAFVASIAAIAVCLVGATIVSLLFARDSALNAHRAEIANNFLLTVLDLTDRFEEKSDGEQTLSGILERAITLARVELKQEPDVHATVLFRLSSSLQHRGQLESATLAAREAYTIRARQGEPLGIIESAQRLASLEIDRGELESSQAYLDEAMHQLLHADVPDTVRIRVFTSLGKLASLKGDAEASLDWYQQIIPLRENISGDNRSDMAMDYGNLATGLYNLGRYRESSDAYDRAVRLLPERLDSVHPRLGVLLYGHSMALLQLGRLAEAESRVTAAEAALQSQDAGGSIFSAGGDTERARALLDMIAGDYASALERISRLLQRGSPVVLPPTLTLRGRVHLGAGDAAAASASFAEAEQLFIEGGRENHPRRWYAHGLRGVALSAGADVVRGDQMLDEAIVALSAEPSRDSAERVELLLYAGTAARRRGELALALSHHEHASRMQVDTGWLGELGVARVGAELALDRLAEGNRALAAPALAQLGESIRVIERIAPQDGQLGSLRTTYLRLSQQ